MSRGKAHKSALSVSEGVSQPGSINPRAVRELRSKRKQIPDNAELIQGIMEGDISSLSQAITLTESSLEEHRARSQEVLAACLPYRGRAFRLGITGVPGAGKSTFIEALGKHLVERGEKIAVLAIDPSSKRSGGSILGDKTRMEELATLKGAYIRPSPSGGTLGGVARKTRESILLCEAAGFDNILVETVGVGQSETAVHSMVDFFLLIMLAGAGDELQGIKRGIMEMADAIVINKADGNNIARANRARAEYSNALHLFPPSPTGWAPRVETCSSLYNEGIPGVWELCMDYLDLVRENGWLERKRQEQSRYWMHESIREGIYEEIFSGIEMQEELKQLEKELEQGGLTPHMAASRILDRHFNRRS